MRAVTIILALTLALCLTVEHKVEASPQGQDYQLNTANQKRFTVEIARAAKKHQVDPALIRAIISAESAFNPKAVSPAGAIGLMQVLPQTAAEYGVSELFDPVTNIDVGTRHFKRLLTKYKNISHALAAYNAGEGRVKRYRRAVPYLETRKYVVRVLNLYMRYKK